MAKKTALLKIQDFELSMKPPKLLGNETFKLNLLIELPRCSRTPVILSSTSRNPSLTEEILPKAVQAHLNLYMAELPSSMPSLPQARRLPQPLSPLPQLPQVT